YLGGSNDDIGVSIAIDGAQNVYVTGVTSSTNFPTVGPLQATNRGGDHDVFVAKVNAAGNALTYSTYLGGSGDDVALSIAVDDSGNAYVAGGTDSTNFPTANPLQPTNDGKVDAFVIEFNLDGSALLYSSYLGGSDDDFAFGIALDNLGNLYVAGSTASTNFPT